MAEKKEPSTKDIVKKIVKDNEKKPPQTIVGHILKGKKPNNK